MTEACGPISGPFAKSLPTLDAEGHYGYEDQGHTLRTIEHGESLIKPLDPSWAPHLQSTCCVTQTFHAEVTRGRFPLIPPSTENHCIGWGSKVQVTAVFKEKRD